MSEKKEKMENKGTPKKKKMGGAALALPKIRKNKFIEVVSFFSFFCVVFFLIFGERREKREKEFRWYLVRKRCKEEEKKEKEIVCFGF